MQKPKPLVVWVLLAGACLWAPGCRLAMLGVAIVKGIADVSAESDWTPTPDMPPGPHGLTRERVQAVMASIKRDIGVCYARHNVPGLVRVRVQVNGNDGLPRRVTVLGPMAATPTGRCVAQAVARTQFPLAWRDTTFVYAFHLRPAVK